MDNDKLFENFSSQTLDILLNAPFHSECSLVKIQKSPQGLSLGLSQKDQYQHIPFQLQTRFDYVLQLTSDGNHIISGFQCNIDKTFKLFRSSTSDENEVGEVNGIEFRSSIFPKQNVFLYVPDQDKQLRIKDLEKFAQTLAKKYIIQDGFHDVYRAIKKIGKGVTASVYKAIRLSDQKQLAVKSFKKQQYFVMDNGRGKAAFQKEFKTMTQIESKYVSKLVGVFESQNSVYIVMQLFSKSLYVYLKTSGILEVSQTRQIMRKLLIGLRDIHSKSLMHRDLKLENIMVLEYEGGVQPKIIDFGLAQNWHNSDFLYLKCGTPGYVAPQILNLNSKDHPRPPYSYQCDIFSLGVIFYMLQVFAQLRLAGKVLFDGSDEREVIKKNRDCEIDFSFPDQNKLTEEMKDLLRKMLQKDPQKRLNADTLLTHSFFGSLNSSSMQNQIEN